MGSRLDHTAALPHRTANSMGPPIMKNASLPLMFALCLAVLLARPADAASLDPADIGESIFSGLFDRHGDIPACDNPRVEAKIKNRFRRYTDRHVLERGLNIESFAHIRQARYDIGNPSPLARRYCQARAHFNDNRSRRVFYFVEEQFGFVGIKWNVEFCVAGLDPWRVYDGKCRVARPQ